MPRLSAKVPVVPGQQHRRPDIQGMRALALIIIMVFHAGIPIPGGFAALDIFFVVSGFVITGLLRREWNATGRIDFGNFYRRRFKRLMPAMALTVTVTLALSFLLLSPLGIQQTAAMIGIGALLVSANFVAMQKTGGYFDALQESNPLLHTWSLSLEEQFYLVFPAFMALVWFVASGGRSGANRASNRVLGYVLVGLLGVVSFLFAVRGLQLLDATPLPWSVTHKRMVQGLFGYYSPLTRSWEFVVGVLLAMFAHRFTGIRRPWSSRLGGAGAVGLVAALFLISEKDHYPGFWTLLPVASTVLLLIAGAGESNLVTRALSTLPMVRMGDWSYSIYLWHWPVIVFAGVLFRDSPNARLIAAVASVIPAVVAYRWVEEPFRQMRSFNGARARRIALALVLVPLSIGVSLLFTADRGYWSPGVRSMQAAVQTHALKPQCTALGLHDPGYLAECTFNSSAPNKPIYLLGDSMAWNYSEAAISAGEQLGRPVVMVSMPPWCNFADLYVIPFHGDGPACREGYEAAMTWLSGQPAGTVVIATKNVVGDPLSRIGDKPNAILAADVINTDPDRYWQIADAGLASTVRKIESLGNDVVLALPPPSFVEPERFEPNSCRLTQLMSGNCVGRMSAAESDAYWQLPRFHLERVAAETGAGEWDPRPLFCNRDICTTQKDGLNLYHDSVHISSGASLLLGPSLAQALGERRLTRH